MAWLALLLAHTAGFVDAVGYLALFGVAVRDVIHPIAPPKPPAEKPDWKP